jgi:uncharacterized membrane-anchored protein
LIKFIGIIGIAANSLILAFGLSAFVMGIVFFLIGLPQMKKKSVSAFFNKDLAYIMATMAILLTFLILMGFTIYLSKELLFSSALSSVETPMFGKQLLFVIGVVVLWGFVCTKWLLPIFFDPIKLNKKQMTVIVTGIVSMIVVGVDAVTQN